MEGRRAEHGEVMACRNRGHGQQSKKVVGCCIGFDETKAPGLSVGRKTA
ncbi:hypothetical protein P9199_15425 [Geobacillus stearothermophilus]|nr:hypothetical protein [Geobacillus stearothermophilus]